MNAVNQLVRFAPYAAIALLGTRVARMTSEPLLLLWPSRLDNILLGLQQACGTLVAFGIARTGYHQVREGGLGNQIKGSLRLLAGSFFGTLPVTVPVLMPILAPQAEHSARSFLSVLEDYKAAPVSCGTKVFKEVFYNQNYCFPSPLLANSPSTALFAKMENTGRSMLNGEEEQVLVTCDPRNGENNITQSTGSWVKKIDAMFRAFNKERECMNKELSHS